MKKQIMSFLGAWDKMPTGKHSMEYVEKWLKGHEIDVSVGALRDLVRGEFTLHDGEDENLTQRLHVFLEEAKIEGEFIHEWEGHGDGITIYPTPNSDHESNTVIEVSPGDTIVKDDNGNITIRRKA